MNPESPTELVLPEEYTKYSPSIGIVENFLLHDSGPSTERILIFGRLLPSKKEKVYRRFFNEVESLGDDFENFGPETFSCDFEHAIINQFSALFQSSVIGGCLFHLAKNVQKKVNELHLNTVNENDCTINEQPSI